MSFWKVLRVLVTDACNYTCIYCHNEGQPHKKGTFLKKEDFIKVVEALQGTGINEIRFSGGEPFVNKQVVEMIQWASEHTDYEIGCATNGQLLNTEIIQQLSNTRVRLTLHYPANNQEGYAYVTGGNYKVFKQNLELLEVYNIPHSFNFVLYPEINKEFEDVLKGVIKRKRGLKILPYIDVNQMNISEALMMQTREKLDSICKNKQVVDSEGIEIWYLENGSKIKLLHSPCYTENLHTCKAYGEVRLLPNLKLQKCILDDTEYDLNMQDANHIRKDFETLWNSFTKCYQVTTKQ